MPTGADGLHRVDRWGLIDQIERARSTPPVGLLLVGWDPPTDGVGSNDHLIERSIVFAVAACTESTDTVVAASTCEVAIVRAPLRAPAAAESLAHRLAQRLDTELERLAVEARQPRTAWAIGVAVARPEDRGSDLVRHGHSALDDAWLLGGRRLVAFDDGDRELLGPTEPDHS